MQIVHSVAIRPVEIQLNSALNDLGGSESESVGLTVTFHESHESVPLLGGVHDVYRLDGLWLSIGKSCVDLGGGDFTLVVDHEHSCDITLCRCAGIKNVWVVEVEGGNSAGTISGTCELDIRDALFVEATDELDSSVEFCRCASGGRDRGKSAREGGSCDKEGSGEHGLHCGNLMYTRK